jgi:hypothetical protein
VLSDAERALAEELFAKVAPILEKIYGKTEGSLN